MDTNCGTLADLRKKLKRTGFRNQKSKQAFQNLAQIHDFLTVCCYDTDRTRKAKDQIITAFNLVDVAIQTDLIPQFDLDSQMAFEFLAGKPG